MLVETKRDMMSAKTSFLVSPIHQDSMVRDSGIVEHLEKLKTSFSSKPHGGLPEEALYLCDTVKPLMAKLRTAVDAAENLMEQGVCLGKALRRKGTTGGDGTMILRRKRRKDYKEIVWLVHGLLTDLMNTWDADHGKTVLDLAFYWDLTGFNQPK